MQTRHDPLGPALVAVATPTLNSPPRGSEPAAVPSSASVSAPPRGGLKKVSLGGIAKKKEDTTNKYPVYPDPEGKAAEIAARIVERQDQFDALESALKTDKEELSRVFIRPWYFEHFHRKTEVPSSVLVNCQVEGEDGKKEACTVRVTVKEQYYSFPSEDPFLAVLGEKAGEFFRQSFELKIAGDKLPADKAAELVEKIQQLFAQYDCADALEAKECIVPVENFKARRLAELELAESLALEGVGDKGLTMVTVSTKGVRK